MLMIYVLGTLLVAAGLGICYCCHAMAKMETNKDLEIMYLESSKQTIIEEAEDTARLYRRLKKELEKTGNQLVDQAINQHDLESTLDHYKVLHANQARSVEEFQNTKRKDDNTILSLRGQISRLKLDVSDLLDPSQARITLPELIARCREDIKSV